MLESSDGSIAFEENFTRLKTFPSERTIVGIGQEPQATVISGTNIEKTEYGLYQTDLDGRTQKEGVFAAGDVVTGPRTVVAAIAFAKRVEKALDEYCQALPKKGF